MTVTELSDTRTSEYPIRPPGIRRLRALMLPFLASAVALGAAVTGALLSGDSSGTGGINGFVEGLSGNSSSRLGNLGLLAPLGFAFAAGMASAVNPCGFAMLPAYLGLYLVVQRFCIDG